MIRCSFTTVIAATKGATRLQQRMADRGQNRTLTVVPVGKLIDLDDELEEAGSLDLTAPKGAETGMFQFS